MDTEFRWDVVVVEYATRVVETVVGTSLNERQADRRMATVMPRLNDRFGVVQVPAGSLKKGDVWGGA